MGQPRPRFDYFRAFQIQFYRKIVDFNRIRTHIVGVEGEHADHLPTTTTQDELLCYRSNASKIPSLKIFFKKNYKVAQIGENHFCAGLQICKLLIKDRSHETVIVKLGGKIRQVYFRADKFEVDRWNSGKVRKETGGSVEIKISYIRHDRDLKRFYSFVMYGQSKYSLSVIICEVNIRFKARSD